MRIGQLSALTAVSTRSLRYYEEQGLISSTRTPGGQREYEPAVVDRVIQVQEFLAAGLCSSKIAELLPCLEAPNAEAVAFLRTELNREHARLDALQRDLARAKAVLSDISARLESESKPSSTIR